MDKTTKLTSIGCGHLVLDAEVEQLLEKVSLLPHILVDSLMFYDFFSFTGLIKIGSFYIYLSYNGEYKGAMVLDCLRSVCWVIRTTFLERTLLAGTNDVMYRTCFICTACSIHLCTLYILNVASEALCLMCSWCAFVYLHVITVHTGPEHTVQILHLSNSYFTFIVVLWRTASLEDLPGGGGGISAPQYCTVVQERNI